ncbi:hypothetical protein [Kribbella sp. NPDC051620]|uniref:hypothetical protein n=1 Tax=Kribbella sp. NPDC051620 TaxID=3364120 RepID=UPI0037873814
MSTADTWSAELESTGQVIFPQRRNRLWVRAAVAAFFFSNSLWSLIAHIRADDMTGVVAVLRITSLGAFVYFLAITAWQLVTRRPVLTVNRAGVQLGKRGRFVPWHEIARIDDPPVASFAPGLRSIQLQPTDRHGSRALAINHEFAADLMKLAAWLRTLHANQTHPTTG